MSPAGDERRQSRYDSFSGGIELKAIRYIYLPNTFSVLPLVKMLRSVGTADELKARREQLVDTVASIRHFLDHSTTVREGNDKRSARAGLSRVENVLPAIERQEREARAIEETLTARGWKYDPDTRKVTALSGRSGQPKHLLRSEVEALYREKNGAGNWQSTRDAIATELSIWFTSDEIDSRDRGPIWHVLNELARP